MRTQNGLRYWLNLLAFTLFLVILVLAGAFAWYTYARTISFIQPPRHSASAQLLEQRGIQYQEVELLTDDGLKLRAWYTAPKNGAVILLAHGSGGSMPVDYYLIFAENGYGVLAWEFRGHGDSQGEYTTIGYLEALDVKAALDYALNQPGVEHAGAWGGSMGAAAVIHAAAMYPEIEAVVSDSGFTTLKEIADMRTGFKPMRPLVRLFGWMKTGVDLEWMKPEEDIRRISPRAVFIIQGLEDHAISADSAQRLYQAAGEPRELWVEPGIGHLGMYPAFGSEYIERVLNFFEKYLLN